MILHPRAKERVRGIAFGRVSDRYRADSHLIAGRQRANWEPSTGAYRPDASMCI